MTSTAVPYGWMGWTFANGICKSFGANKANDSVDLTLHRGDILGLLGENGAGKTTLMNVLFGTYAADEGTIEIQHFDGTVEELDFDDWAASWHDREIETAAAPEDWSGSVDMDAEDDAGTSLRDAR